MSGHSKWSTIKRQKQANDQSRSKIFTKLANSITISVKEGGGIVDSQVNFKLRLAIEKAKSFNMPKVNIDRAIEKGKGQTIDIHNLSEVVYEGFSHTGIAIIAIGITDNKLRTQGLIKNIFFKHGGNLASLGSVLYLFSQVGEIQIQKYIDQNQLFDLAELAGGIDFEEKSDVFIVYAHHHDLHLVKDKLIVNGVKILNCELIYKPINKVEIPTEELQKIKALVHELNDMEEIHKVFTNAV